MKKTTPLIIGLALTVLLAALMPFDPAPLPLIENKLLDYRFRIRGPLPETPHSERIVIAEIDEKSLAEIGRWPWSRDVLARLVEKIDKGMPALIVFDVLFVESEQNDPLFARSIRDASFVILATFFDSVDEQHFFARHKSDVVDLLKKEAMGIGHINMFSDPDGTLRWTPLSIDYIGDMVSTRARDPRAEPDGAASDLDGTASKVRDDAGILAGENLRAGSGIDPKKLDMEQFFSLGLLAAAHSRGVYRNLRTTAKGIYFDQHTFIPTDKRGRMLINYYGPVRRFKHISITDILHDRVDFSQLEEKIVLVGATATGLYDLRVTPFSPVMPGVEKHASVVASILDGRFLRRAPLPHNLALLLLAGAASTFFAVRFRAVGASVATLLLLGTYLFAGVAVFLRNGLWINVTYPSAGIVLIFVASTACSYAVEERHARRIRAMFSSYVSPRIVEQLIKNPSMMRLGGERREITVLFSDIRGFTTFSENNTPEDVVSLLNEYLAAMTDVVFRWEGTLDKFIGDAIMAFWGAPVPQEDHAQRAVQCALDMVDVLMQLQKKWKAEGKPVLDCGIGINTGEVVVGNTGAEGKKMDYTVIGDDVNLAARAEGLTRQYGERILLTEFTVGKLKGAIESSRPGGAVAVVKPIERVTVKGKQKPVEIYKVITV